MFAIGRTKCDHVVSAGGAGATLFAVGSWSSTADAARVSPRRALFASFNEKLFSGQLEHFSPSATWHCDAPADASTAFTQALSINFSANGNPSSDCDFLISHRTFSFGLAHFTQTGIATAIVDAIDRLALSQSVLRLAVIFAKPNIGAPEIATLSVPRSGAGNEAIASPICIVHLMETMPIFRTIQIANIAAAVLPFVARSSSRSTRILRILRPGGSFLSASARLFERVVRRLLKAEAVESKTKYALSMDAPCTSL